MFLAQFYVLDANAAGAVGGLSMFLPLILIMGVMYLLMIRPQKKKEQQLRDQINAMEVGDEVITIGGIVGRVFNIQNDEVTIATSVQNTLMTFKKSAINHVIKKGTKTTAKAPAAAAEKTAAESEEKKGFLGKLFNRKKDEVE